MALNAIVSYETCVQQRETFPNKVPWPKFMFSKGIEQDVTPSGNIWFTTRVTASLFIPLSHPAGAKFWNRQIQELTTALQSLATATIKNDSSNHHLVYSFYYLVTHQGDDPSKFMVCHTYKHWHGLKILAFQNFLCYICQKFSIHCGPEEEFLL